jgi:hypothetical protein
MVKPTRHRSEIVDGDFLVWIPDRSRPIKCKSREEMEALAESARLFWEVSGADELSEHQLRRAAFTADVLDHYIFCAPCAMGLRRKIKDSGYNPNFLNS